MTPNLPGITTIYISTIINRFGADAPLRKGVALFWLIYLMFRQISINNWC